MTFNLLTDPFFPIITRSGASRMVRFAELAQVDGDDAPVDFDWPRPDFNIAAFEFAIGVAMLAFAPQDHDEWLELWQNPPSEQKITADIAFLTHAFNLDGDGPRFLQDFAPIEGEANPIEALLIDTPGANGQKENKDLLTHRNRYAHLGCAASAMALYALQQFAPLGGAGHRTSIRGGGPLTTLIMPGSAQNTPTALFYKILANLPFVDAPMPAKGAALDKILPWLAPTLLSDKASGERKIHEADPAAHPLQAFFGMPRRIRLVFSVQSGACPMTGETGPMIGGFVQKPWGPDYGLWLHPLTPHRRQKESEEPYSVKPKSGRFGYRDWVTVTFGSPKDTALAMPAGNIKAAGERAPWLRGPRREMPTIRLGGWAMNSMGAVAYLYAEQPFYVSEDADQREVLAALARSLAAGGDKAHDILRFALRTALFSEGAKVSTDGGVFASARSAFYSDGELDFHALLGEATTIDDVDNETISRRWLATLRVIASRLFQENTPKPGADQKTARRIANAHNILMVGFSGHGAKGKALFDALKLPAVETKKAKKESRK